MNHSFVPDTSYWQPPNVSQAAFIASNAVVMGKVTIQKGANIWYGAVVRGDVEEIVIGKYSNVQDGAILHGDPGQPTILEDYVTIGHRAVVLDGVRVGAASIIGAGCIVTKDVEPRSLMVGVPARKVREISEEEAAELIAHAQKYYKLALVHAGKGTDLGFV